MGSAGSHGGTVRMIRAEPVLLIQQGDTLQASLLYEPSVIVDLTNHAKKWPVASANFSWSGRNLQFPAGVPHLKSEDLFPAQPGPYTVEWHADGKRYLHFKEGGYFHGLQLWFDYQTTEPALGLHGRSGEGVLRGAAQKLRQGRLRVALLGDSISEGANASGRSGVAPWHAPYFELFLERLRPETAIEARNFSVGGKTSTWGVEESKSVAAWKPDLVVVAFGMNDASEGYSAERFGANLREIKDVIQGKNPAVEFVWLSGMTPHPEWHLARPDLRQEHHEILRRMAGEGSAFCDVMTGWREIVARKGFLSVTGNGVNHPNDFGHRLYAECLAYTLEKAAGIS